ncbi:MAG TPA: hypothetical protein DEQ61_24400 [Streptomyces sp.]|nr:hypothetical protein [Streptomyces sp.]
MGAPRRHSAAALLVAAAVLVSGVAVALALPAAGEPPARTRTGPAAGRTPGQAAERAYEAVCRTEVTGSRATADCHNPYPVVDRVRLHIECDRWWDLDVDTGPVEVGPAQTVRLSAGCWMPVRAAWVTHEVR